MGSRLHAECARQMSVPLSAKAVLQADICQLGMDQRKVNMLAREYCDDIKRKLKPVILSHAMLPGLKQARSALPWADLLCARAACQSDTLLHAD